MIVVVAHMSPAFLLVNVFCEEATDAYDYMLARFSMIRYTFECQTACAPKGFINSEFFKLRSILSES